MDNLKTPPNNVEAERAVLGSILLDTMGRDERVMDACLSAGVTPETFFDPRNRALFMHMEKMARCGKPLDPLSFNEDLRVNNLLEAIGGAAYLQSLLDQTPTTAHAEYYIGVIVAKHLRRTMIDRATRTIEMCYDEGKNPDAQAVLGVAEKSFLEIGVRSDATVPWAQAVESSLGHIEALLDAGTKTLQGLSTGLSQLDERLQGLKPSEMVVIAARPSVGKTSLAMNIAESCAMGRMLTLRGGDYPIVESDGGKRHPVLIFSLEMPIEALTKRMVAGRAQVNTWRLNRGIITKDERNKITERLYGIAEGLRSAPIYVDDTASLDVMDLRARARRMKKQHGIELIVIDYLQLCTCREAARMGSRQVEVGMISQQIKAMAKELRIPVIVLSQLSRANEQRGDKEEKPRLSDLRDSGAIEQDADVVMLLRRPSRTAQSKDIADETLAIINVAKNRNGETGEVNVNFRKDYTRFEDRPLPLKTPDGFESSEPQPEQGEFAPDPIL